MKDRSAQIRFQLFQDQAFFKNADSLTYLDPYNVETNVKVTNIVNRDTDYPFVLIRSNSVSGSEENQTAYGSDVIITFEVHTKFKRGQGGDKLCNDLTSKILEKVISRSENHLDTTAQGFKTYVIELDALNYQNNEFDDGNYFRSIIDINFKTMEI
jgi:hypothetical protein